MSPRHGIAMLAYFHLLTLLSYLPVTLGWSWGSRHNSSIGQADVDNSFLRLERKHVPNTLLACHSPIFGRPDFVIHGLGQPNSTPGERPPLEWWKT
ncbi:unnamed protein product [Vitrella brassicaformis CCMP3155]|uniref:Uncharacterized protein n=1 Tax=Vitrella brassicaformis (strain CCMP3155) TaxID=1169540 RepID=A0A0G4GMX6_VITBC|nr:unnamed protein product [Vitrella brassicaformis CCMP3155]|eukprot:CEM31549.1 unnamed protein product [Vitrella brassicaformis CCMP3155]